MEEREPMSIHGIARDILGSSGSHTDFMFDSDVVSHDISLSNMNDVMPPLFKEGVTSVKVVFEDMTVEITPNRKEELCPHTE